MKRWLARREPVVAFLGLGSNLGDRLETLKAALVALDGHRDVTVEDASGVYETAPVSDVPQDSYLNLVAKVSTRLKPLALLGVAHEVEAGAGRDRSRELRWGPRTLDVDVLLYGDQTIDTPALTVPHPRLTQRAFALIPLMEVMPGGSLPDGTNVSGHLARLAPIAGIDLFVRLEGVPGAPPPRPLGPVGPAPSFDRPEPSHPRSWGEAPRP